MDDLLSSIYYNPETGYIGASALYKKVKGQPGITLQKVKDWVKQQEVSQLTYNRKSRYNSFVANEPLQQFQIDLIFLKDEWINKGYHYALSCVDVFSKKGEVIPMKDKNASTVTKAMNDVFNKIGVPKSIYSDQGSEFKNHEFQSLMDKHNIQLIFTIDHAPFVEAFNKTIKTKLSKIMIAKKTKNWVDSLPSVVKGYNNTEHSTTGIAPNDVNKKTQGQVLGKIMNRAKTKNYETIKTGDQVRIAMMKKGIGAKGYTQSWSSDVYKVSNTPGSGVYEVNGTLHPRKDLQVIKGVQSVAPEKTSRDKSKLAGKAEKSSKLMKKDKIIDKETAKEAMTRVKATQHSKRGTRANPTDQHRTKRTTRSGKKS